MTIDAGALASRRRFLARLGSGTIAAFALCAFSGASAQGRPFRMSAADWKRLLGPERYAVLRQAATERPFSSPLNSEHRRGTFLCAGCALPLFSSAAKFDSHTGWPSFFRPLSGAVETRPDHSLGMRRTEVLCRRCESHLGHVFPDGPQPTGLRYCMNGLALNFRPA